MVTGVVSFSPPGTRLHCYRAKGLTFPTLVEFHRILHDVTASSGFFKLLPILLYLIYNKPMGTTAQALRRDEML